MLNDVTTYSMNNTRKKTFRCHSTHMQASMCYVRRILKEKQNKELVYSEMDIYI